MQLRICLARFFCVRVILGRHLQRTSLVAWTSCTTEYIFIEIPSLYLIFAVHMYLYRSKIQMLDRYKLYIIHILKKMKKHIRSSLKHQMQNGAVVSTSVTRWSRRSPCCHPGSATGGDVTTRWGVEDVRGATQLATLKRHRCGLELGKTWFSCSEGQVTC